MLPAARANGLREHELAARIFPQDPPDPLGFFDASRAEPRASALMSALGSLQSCGLVERTPIFRYWKASETGRLLRDNLPAVWQPIIDQQLKDDAITVIKAVNRSSPRARDGYVTIEGVTGKDWLQELGLAPDVDLACAILSELRDAGLVSYHHQFAHVEVSASYAGLVWETRRGFTVESQHIDGLVAEWETTSVEFKQELGTDTADAKAELIKDLIGLANTQASGRRWLIIGFNDKTRAYHNAPDPKITQDHLEQLIAAYIQPNLRIRYDVVGYRSGPVGRLEVFRETEKVPYTVAKAIHGRKKQVKESQVFVRHGEHVEESTPAELRALLDESERVRPTAP